MNSEPAEFDVYTHVQCVCVLACVYTLVSSEDVP